MKSSLSLTTIFLAVSAIPLAAQQPDADAAWSRVGQLTPGIELIVTVKGEAPVRRLFFSGDGSRLRVLNRAQGVEDFERSDIAEIKVERPHSAERDALKGFLFGSAAYGLVGGLACKAFGGTGSCAGDVAKSAAFGGGFMAAISVGAGAIKHRVKPAQVIYRAP
jgi:hypothetical protein